ncbi:hypothetical protein [Actinoplanes sp. HUAS TT8]|uniref:hypothetical protein n=1 Tax=Actinoplanes sp. HUAS TT8 TaxID=3447453 RepID=UPI003F51C538
MQAEDGAVSAADLVVTQEPPDDAGARTADLYEWQAVMAAADGLRLYLNALGTSGELVAAEGCRVLCERHEDWVILRDRDAELISAKHPGLSFGAYTTLNSLADDGGVGHLFNRWMTMGEQATCRLVTTAGVDKQPKQLTALADTLQQRRLAGVDLLADGEFEELLDAFGAALLKHCDGLPERWSADAGGQADAVPSRDQRRQMARFLSMFRYQPSPLRDYVGFAAPSMYVQPVLRRLGSSVPADAVWGAVLSLFRARMRACGPTEAGGLPAVLAAPVGAGIPSVAELEKDLMGRIVTLGDIDVAVRAALAFPSGFARLPRMQRTSRLAIKMEVGGCSDNAVERAEQLRLDYQDLMRERMAGDPLARAEEMRLRRMLLRISDTATSRVSDPDAEWGTALWRELEASLEQQAAKLPDDMDVDLALGGLCDLSNRCQVWFSEKFDIDSEVERRRGEGGGGS